MQFPTLALLGLAGSVLAAPAPQQAASDIPSFNQPFAIEAQGPGLTNARLRAVNGRLMIGGAQKAECASTHVINTASFVTYSDKRLYMYTDSTPVQNVWVDASGMGQGITGYSTPDRVPAKGSLDPFVISPEGDLTFLDSKVAKACPGLEPGQWSIWFTTSEKPANQDGCITVTLKTIRTPHAVPCQYAESQ
ncbi:hypothetical protein CERZMDRAFT_96359 [Cercospora zeae-maydis SCOH1-5]|uniref:Cell wall protein PhiA n=1 Tax=Cercospora zeae-maydis SCOH1-5 TaxID=717836 RepID=A0A6A6FJA5_9PEZI|nr:hypothetical protein CERZMDRAFT_96359 [Cercospora zeae-maydis SCOH1-5]